ncbi:MAG: hypothetical protein V3S37_02360 [Dehalococcoidia bacterium]
MSIVLFDPVGDIEVAERAQEKALDTLKGKAVGYIFNQHVSSLVFWKYLEQNLGSALEPSKVVGIHKPNTWAPAPGEEVERIIRETDFALVGVGA